LLLPATGAHQLRILASNLLKLTLITTKAPDPAKVKQWDFVDDDGQVRLLTGSEYGVLAGDTELSVRAAGFQRRVLYAPLARRDLRIGNHLYLRVSPPIAEGQRVEVKNPGGKLWAADLQFSANADPLRFCLAIHVNQVGNVPAFPKKAMIGFFLGSLGEMDVSGEAGAHLVEAHSGKPVFQCKLKPRRDASYYSSLPYQRVLEADFSEFKTPGEYQLVVPGLGASFPFFIDDGAAAAFTRAYALGLYHQRCGASNTLPFTRFVHGPCHIANVN
jgi:hypothetical protein